jgi:hypothetical protein
VKELPMKIRLAVLAAAVAALALAAPALAKGPSEATIEGPGLKGGGIHLTSGGGDPGSGTPLGNLTEFGGYFPATFGQEPNPMLSKRPKGDLGPKYTVVYKVPGPGGDTATIRQDLYPYATPTALTYTKPGQSFFGDQRTRGGWFEAPPDLKAALDHAGLPAAAPSESSGDSWLPSWPATTGIVFVVLVVALATIAFAARRRLRMASA